MRKVLIMGAVIAALGLFAMSAPVDAATRNAGGIANAQTIQLSAHRYYRGYYHRRYRYYGGYHYYRPYRYYGYYRPYYYRPYYYGAYDYYPYYRRPGIYFGFGW